MRAANLASGLEGAFADRPNAIWRVDVTVVRSLDGTKIFVQSVLDDFSRKILAHRVFLAWASETL